MLFPRIVLCLSLSVPALGWAFTAPVPLPLADEPVIAIDAGGIDIAAGTISQDVTIANPRGATYDRQVLRIELASATKQRVTWGTQFQPQHGLRLPTHTTGGNVFDLWIFEYISRLRVWSLIGTTQPVFVPVPAGRAQ
jgi:hypothetical protein